MSSQSGLHSKKTVPKNKLVRRPNANNGVANH
jgi:hypothetical protein